MNRRSSPRTLTIKRLAGRAARVDAQGLDVHAVSHQGFGGKTSKDVVADTGADGDTDAQPGEVHGGVGGSAADVENKLIDRDELARARQASDRRRQMIDDHHARAGDHGQGGGRNCSFRRIWHGHDCRFPAREGHRTAGVTAGKHARRLTTRRSRGFFRGGDNGVGVGPGNGILPVCALPLADQTQRSPVRSRPRARSTTR